MSNACGKARFSTWNEAYERLKEIQARGKEHRKYNIPTRVYKCQACRGFHLTSKERREKTIPLEEYNPKWLKLIK